jgi:hypothetical protein
MEVLWSFLPQTTWQENRKESRCFRYLGEMIFDLRSISAEPSKRKSMQKPKWFAPLSHHHPRYGVTSFSIYYILIYIYIPRQHSEIISRYSIQR